MASVELEVQLGADYVTRQTVVFDDNVRLSLSPYDIPRSVRLAVDKSARQLTIDFKYLTTDEPKLVVMIDGDTILNVGKSSNKLYGIIVKNVDIANPKETTKKLIRALEIARGKYDARRPQECRPYMNFSLAKDFLASEEDEISSLSLTKAG